MAKEYPADACGVPPGRDHSFRALVRLSLNIWSTNLEMNLLFEFNKAGRDFESEQDRKKN